jgi:hypothetical protein
MKVERVSVRQKIGVALAIFLAWFFFTSLLYGNIGTNRFGFRVLGIVMILGGPIILFWSLVLHSVFLKEELP